MNWWAEEWSFGAGPSRLSCGISRTEEGYAVDVFRGDTCVESFVYRDRAEAVGASRALKRQYQQRRTRPTATSTGSGPG